MQKYQQEIAARFGKKLTFKSRCNGKQIYYCDHCNSVITGPPIYDMIRPGFPIFCTTEHLEQFTQHKDAIK